MKLRIGFLIAAAAICAASSAGATTTILLNGGGVNTPGANTVSGLNVGNIRTFTSGSVTLTAQGWTYDTSYTPDQLLASNLGFYSGGLGVSSPLIDTNGSTSGTGMGGSQESGTGAQHSVDNNADGRIDFVLLKFSTAVDLTSVYLTVWDVGTSGDVDGDATVFYRHGATAPANGGDAEAYLSQFTSIDLPGSASGSRNVPGVTFSDTWLVAAAANSYTNDGFKLKSVSFAVPEPSTWLFMIIGFGGLGTMLRRQRRSGPVPS
jgi:hypothetical protein